MARTDFHKVVIGRAEMLSFLDPVIEQVPAKTDTGAYRSAAHADRIKLSADGKTLSFRLMGGHPMGKGMEQTITTSEFAVVKVSNSFGQTEERYEVKLRVKVGPKIFRAAFSLANRSKKTYPILLGRKLLNDRFLVDTSKSSVDRVKLKTLYGIDFPADEEGEE